MKEAHRIPKSKSVQVSAKDIRSSLQGLYSKHRGKVSDKWSIYLGAYDRIISGYRNNPVRLLEIGVQNGGSLEIWRKYFPRARLILGCDVNESCGKLIFNDEKIAVIVGDANSQETERKIVKRSAKFDIIIDDGSHRSSDVVSVFARYFPYLSEGGIYIVEDLHCSYWQGFEGGLYDPLSSMSFFKRLLDVINYEHWGLDRTRIAALAPFAERHKATFEEASLASIHAIEFLNSLCVVTKRSPQLNVLGRRQVKGRVASVADGMMSLDGVENKVANQNENPWSFQTATMEDEIESNRDLVQRQRTHIEALSHEVVASREQISRGEDEIARAHAERAALEERLAQCQLAVRELRDSTSWRITEPLRALSAYVNRLLRIADR